jgi:hypothetical protein
MALRAALNHAFETDKVDSEKAWRKVKPFKSVNKARIRYLTVAEAKRLINASDPEFRQLVQAALLTGGRYGQIAQLTVSDFNAPRSGSKAPARTSQRTQEVEDGLFVAHGQGVEVLDHSIGLGWRVIVARRRKMLVDGLQQVAGPPVVEEE